MKIEYTQDGIRIGDEFISLEDISYNCLKTKVDENDLNLLQIEWSGRRGFDGCYEYIVASKPTIARIVEIITGVMVEFGEIAGKHSDIRGTIDESDINIVDNCDGIIVFLQLNPSGHTYNYSFIDNIIEYSDLDTDIIEELECLVYPKDEQDVEDEDEDDYENIDEDDDQF